MKKTLMTFALALLTAAAIAHDKPPVVVEPPPAVVAPAAVDAWNGKDKAYHFGASAIIGFAVAQVEKDKLKAFGYAMIPGTVKEALDDKFSGKDMAWNAAGAALGVYTGHWLLARDREGRTQVSYVTKF